MYSSRHISELLLLASCSVWHSIKMKWHFSSCQAVMLSLTSDQWSQYPSAGAARQQSAYLAGSCHLCASHTLLRNRDWLISASFMIPVISLSCSCGCPAAEQGASSELSSCIISRGSSSSFPNSVNLYFHSSPLSLWFSCSVHLFFLRSCSPFQGGGHRPGRCMPAPNTVPKVSVCDVSKTSFLQGLPSHQDSLAIWV